MNAPVNPKKLIKGATGDWEIVVGMEIHAQVTSQAKLFSGASTAFGGDPNSHVSLVDAAMPGMLPVINEECVRQAIRTGLGLKAEINLKSTFDRKNYFYPDLPQGYQISQYKSPIVGEGEVIVDVPESGETITVRIERLHLEQDAGKSIHLVDVREPAEYEIVSIPGSVLVPKGEIISGNALADLPQDRQIVLYCKTGCARRRHSRRSRRPGSATRCTSRGAWCRGSATSTRPYPFIDAGGLAGIG